MERVKLDGKSVLAGVLGGLCLGGGIGYIAGRLVSRRGEEARIQAEVSSVKSYYRAEADAARESDNSLRLEAEAAMGDYRVDLATSVLREDRGVLPVSLAGNDSDASADGDAGSEAGTRAAEESRRTVVDKTKPYIISYDEFYETDEKGGLMEEKGWRRSSLTYYVQDGVLVDDREVPVTPAWRIIGDAMGHFGELSGDPNIVFVRNEKLEHDFEIIRNMASWTTHVQGLDPSP